MGTGYDPVQRLAGADVADDLIPHEHGQRRQDHDQQDQQDPLEAIHGTSSLRSSPER
jgi:hypothetical protein